MENEDKKSKQVKLVNRDTGAEVDGEIKENENPTDAKERIALQSGNDPDKVQLVEENKKETSSPADQADSGSDSPPATEEKPTPKGSGSAEKPKEEKDPIAKLGEKAIADKKKADSSNAKEGKSDSKTKWADCARDVCDNMHNGSKK